MHIFVIRIFTAEKHRFLGDSILTSHVYIYIYIYGFGGGWVGGYMGSIIQSILEINDTCYKSCVG